MRKFILIGFLFSNLAFSSENVYVVNTKKYHINKSCRTLKKATNIREISIKKIGARTPCKICS